VHPRTGFHVASVHSICEFIDIKFLFCGRFDPRITKPIGRLRREQVINGVRFMAVRRVPGRKDPVERQVIVPVWAQRIRVVQGQSDIAVCGAGLQFSNSSRWNMPEGFSDLLAPFDSAKRAPRSGSRQPPHLRFASASTLGEQVSFVRDFGPILAHKKVEGGRGGDRIVVCQSLAVLKAEQRLFSLFVDLVKVTNALQAWSIKAFAARRAIAGTSAAAAGKRSPSLHSNTEPLGGKRLSEAIAQGAKSLNSRLEARERRTTPEREAMESLPAVIGNIQTAIDTYPYAAFPPSVSPLCWRKVWSLTPDPQTMTQYDWLTILSDANDLLCRVFSQFPSHLYYGEGSAIEVPTIEACGIRPALYFMLRSDYLLRRPYRPCALPDCAKYFFPGRSDNQFCSETCLNRAKQRRYYKRRASSPKKNRSPAS
jgi:hypothetical protein